MTRAALEAAGLKLVTKDQFDAATDVTDWVRSLINATIAHHGGGFVVYEPAAGDDGLLMVADTEDDLMRDALSWIADQNPSQGLLF